MDRSTRGPRRIVSMAFGLAVVGATLAACGSDSSDSGGTIDLKLGHVFTTEEPIHKALIDVADAVESKTDGRVSIKLFPNAELGGDIDVLEQASLGAPILSIVNPTFVSDRGVPDMKIAAGPFMFKTPKQSVCFMNSDYWTGLTDQLEAKSDLVSVNWDWYLGDRHMISSKGFPTPSDLKGVKFRIPPDKTWETLFKVLGASPTVLEWAEVYTALSSGVIDAAEAPLTTIAGAKLQESADKITLTGHYNVPSGFAIHKKVWDKISDADQKVIVDEFKAGAAVATQAAVDKFEVTKKELEGEGVTFVEADYEAYSAAVENFYTKFPEWSDGAVEQAKAAAQACAS